MNPGYNANFEAFPIRRENVFRLSRKTKPNEPETQTCILSVYTNFKGKI